MPEALKTPAEWCIILDARIMDPDGWRGPRGRDWDDPISREEFENRLKYCTIDFRGYPDFMTPEKQADLREKYSA